MTQILPARPAHSPADIGRRPSAARLLFAVCAPPLAWFAQLVVNYSLASTACWRNGAPLLTGGGWDAGRVLQLVLNLLALGLALACAWIATDAARTGERLEPPKRAGLAEARAGRIRFLAACGQLTSLGFAAAILFNTAGVIGSPSCPG